MRLGLIGLGTISQYIKYGLEKSNNLKLAAVCDINKKCKNKELFEKYPFYTDVIEMITKEKIDICYLAIDAEKHFNVASKILKLGIPVITEKPACNSLTELLKLYDLADANKTYFEVLYHFEHGDEIKFLEQNISQYGPIKFIQSFAHEQYAYNDEHILSKDKYSVGDAWLDAGANLLSNIWHFIDLEDMAKLRDIKDFDKTSSKLIYSHKTFKNQFGVEIDLLIDWMTQNETKYTIIQTQKARIVIDHHDQTITANGKTIYNNTPKIHRMYIQYENAFKNYEYDVFNKEKTINIMKILEL